MVKLATAPIELLECPICFTLPSGKVYQCRNGHALCKKCSSGMSNCPICEVQLGKSRIRNTVMEALLESVYRGDSNRRRRVSFSRHKEGHAIQLKLVSTFETSSSVTGMTSLELLECPICLKLSHSKVYQCGRGHIICKRCSNTLTRCPSPECNVVFDTPKVRNGMVEDIIEHLQFDCSNQKNGCTAVLNMRNIVEHLTICDFRPTTLCKTFGLSGCRFTSSSPSTIFNHISDVHEIPMIPDRSAFETTLENFGSDVASLTENVKEMRTWKVRFETHIAELIIYTIIDVERGDFSQVYFHMGNSANDSLQYFITFSILDPYDHNIVKWKWAGEPIHFRQAEHAITNPPFRIPLEYLAEYVGGANGTHDYDLTYTVSVSTHPCH